LDVNVLVDMDCVCAFGATGHSPQIVIPARDDDDEDTYLMVIDPGQITVRSDLQPRLEATTAAELEAHSIEEFREHMQVAYPDVSWRDRA
jgi:hypothetical protein